MIGLDEQQYLVDYAIAEYHRQSDGAHRIGNGLPGADRPALLLTILSTDGQYERVPHRHSEAPIK